MPTSGPLSSRLPASIALGAALSVRGVMTKLTLAWGLFVALGMAIVPLADAGSADTLIHVPSAASSVLAWAVGAPLALAASLHAFRDDRTRGVRSLLRARGGDARDYARGRVLGLALLLFLVVGGGALLSGGLAVLLATSRGEGGRAGLDVLASLVFAAAFALVMAPLALAATGRRSRLGGELGLVVLLVLPELIERWTSRLVPPEWAHLVSVPSALATLRASLTAGEADVSTFVRAACVTVAFAALCFTLVRIEIALGDSIQADEAR